MSDEPEAESVLETMVRARLEHQPMAALPEASRPPDEAAAYALQEELHARLEDAGLGGSAGFKIGCTTPVMQAYLQIPNPCAGGILASTVHEVDGGPAIIGIDGFVRAGVECEIAARLGRDLPPAEQPYDQDSVAPAVESLSAAIEIVDDRWHDYHSIDTPSMIADDFFGAGCVIGAPVTSWRRLDLLGLTGTMTINGSPVGSGHGRDILGHPLDALAWLANQRSDRGLELQAGELVLLGSLVETKWVSAGDLVEIEIEGLGQVGAVFAAPS